MKRVIAAAAAAASVLAIGGVAQAQPKGEPVPYTCDGEQVMVVEAGRNGWVDGEKFQAVSIVVEAGGTVVFAKTWGGGHQLSEEAVTCVSQPEPGVTVTVVAVPA